MYDLMLFIVFCLALIVVSHYLVKSFTKIAVFLRMSEFVLSIIVLAVSTSLPELMVGISAALQNNSAISLGNVIGSNIADLTLIGGIAALLARGLKVKAKLIRRDAYWMVAISIFAVTLMFIGKELSRIDGILLLAVFAIYLQQMISKREQYEPPGAYNNQVSNRWGILAYFLLFLASIPALFYVSHQVVYYGSAMAINWALPPIFVGLFFIALGTSLPELAVTSGAILKKRHGVALGNIIGSVIVNSTVVLGITAIISPITGNLFLFVTSSFFMIVVCFLFAVFLESFNMITWKEGLVLLLMYILFLMVELSLKHFYIG